MEKSERTPSKKTEWREDGDLGPGGVAHPRVKPNPAGLRHRSRKMGVRCVNLGEVGRKRGQMKGERDDRSTCGGMVGAGQYMRVINQGVFNLGMTNMDLLPADMVELRP